MKTTWIVRECSVRQRTLVCSRSDKGVESNIGN